MRNSTFIEFDSVITVQNNASVTSHSAYAKSSNTYTKSNNSYTLLMQIPKYGHKNKKIETKFKNWKLNQMTQRRAQ